MKKIWCCLLISMLMVSCHEKSAQKSVSPKRVIAAKLEQPKLQLFFGGRLSPIKTYPVFSPVAGLVSSVKFGYGEYVSRGQPLFVVHSSSLTAEFRSAVSDFLQKKSSYVNAYEAYHGAKALFQAEVISKDEYHTSQNQFRNSELNFFESQYALEKILKQTGIKKEKVESLSIDDTSAVTAMLRHEFKHIVVNASGSGVALYPMNAASVPGITSGKPVGVGAEVKQGQMMLSIGDLSGFSSIISVSEVSINQIKPGMPVTVTGDAFPGMTLKGYVAVVSSQAVNTSSPSGMALFRVKVNIPHLTQAQQKKIHVGMSAKFEINIQHAAKIYLPIPAVTVNNGVSYVTLLSSSGDSIKQVVTTGDTTPNSIAILQGLKPGDKVLLPSGDA